MKSMLLHDTFLYCKRVNDSIYRISLYPSMMNSSVSIVWYFPIAEQRKYSGEYFDAWNVLYWRTIHPIVLLTKSHRILLCGQFHRLDFEKFDESKCWTTFVFYSWIFVFFFSSACAFVRVLFNRWNSTELFRRCINNNDDFTAKSNNSTNPTWIAKPIVFDCLNLGLLAEAKLWRDQRKCSAINWIIRHNFWNKTA